MLSVCKTPSPCSQRITWVISVNPHNNLQGKCCLISHFPDKANKGLGSSQGGLGTAEISDKNPSCSEPLPAYDPAITVLGQTQEKWVHVDTQRHVLECSCQLCCNTPTQGTTQMPITVESTSAVVRSHRGTQDRNRK